MAISSRTISSKDLPPVKSHGELSFRNSTDAERSLRTSMIGFPQLRFSFGFHLPRKPQSIQKTNFITLPFFISPGAILWENYMGGENRSGRSRQDRPLGFIDER